ncbi:unnamed protein product, partial [Iphiclides podalirius]
MLAAVVVDIAAAGGARCIDRGLAHPLLTHPAPDRRTSAPAQPDRRPHLSACLPALSIARHHETALSKLRVSFARSLSRIVESLIPLII